MRSAASAAGETREVKGRGDRLQEERAAEEEEEEEGVAEAVFLDPGPRWIEFVKDELEEGGSDRNILNPFWVWQISRRPQPACS